MRHPFLLPALLLFACASSAGIAGEWTKTNFAGQDAYLLTDGATEAVVVPEIGRVMRYGRVGGPNFLWNAPAEKLKGDGYLNHGGDKAFIGPHPIWTLMSDRAWPPRPEWDGVPHQAEIVSEGRLRMTSPVWPGFEMRFVREFFFDKGEFVIETTLEPLGDFPQRLAIWTVTQIVPPDAAFLPLDPKSAYADGFHWLGYRATEAAERLSPSLLRVADVSKRAFKIGADSPVAAIAAAKNGLLFLQQSEMVPKGRYPDGAEGAGFPVELYFQPGVYAELELLSPLLDFRKGTSHSHTVRWSLHDLPGKDVTTPEATALVEALFAKPDPLPKTP